MFIHQFIVVVVVVSRVYTYLQTHRDVYIKYVQLSVCQSYLSAVGFFNRKKKKENYKNKTLIKRGGKKTG